MQCNVASFCSHKFLSCPHPSSASAVASSHLPLLFICFKFFFFILSCSHCLPHSPPPPHTHLFEVYHSPVHCPLLPLPPHFSPLTISTTPSRTCSLSPSRYSPSARRILLLADKHAAVMIRCRRLLPGTLLRLGLEVCCYNLHVLVLLLLLLLLLRLPPPLHLLRLRLPPFCWPWPLAPQRIPKRHQQVQHHPKDVPRHAAPSIPTRKVSAVRSSRRALLSSPSLL